MLTHVDIKGAQVSLDTLCGTFDGPNFNATEAQLPLVGRQSKPSQAFLPHLSRPRLIPHSVSAVVLFGDPTYIANQTFNKGTAKKNGVRPFSPQSFSTVSSNH